MGRTSRSGRSACHPATRSSTSSLSCSVAQGSGKESSVARGSGKESSVGQGSGKESSAIPASISLDIEMFGAVDKPGNYLDVKRDVVVMWDPQQYRRFGDERSRPFFDLVGRIDSGNPRSVADLGCGPGNLTATLAERWPEAAVTGVDSSPAMIEAARAGN